MNRKFLTLVAGTLFALAAGSASAAIYPVGDAAAGESQVASCAGCHGMDGNSAMGAFPKLAGLGEKYLAKQLMDIRDGKRVIVEMTGQLTGKTDQQLADMAAFYDGKARQLSGAKQIELVGSSISGDEAIAFGASLYRGGNLQVGIPSCTGCHAPNGAGNEPAGYPALGGQHADYIAKQLRLFRDGLRHNDGEAKVMRGVAERMSNREIDALANYIAGLH